MSTSAVSSDSLYQQLQQYFQTRHSDVQQLGQALEQGNLAAAQTAYNNIVSLGQGGPFASGDPFKIPQREQDFTAIGQALQQGNLAGAQQAFQALRNFHSSNTSQTSDPSSSNEDEVVINLGSGGTAQPLTITISPASGGGEQISIAQGSTATNQLTSNQPTSNPITLNLNSNTNEEVVLNLLGNPSSTGSNASAGGLNISA